MVGDNFLRRSFLLIFFVEGFVCDVFATVYRGLISLFIVFVNYECGPKCESFLRVGGKFVISFFRLFYEGRGKSCLKCWLAFDNGTRI